MAIRKCEQCGSEFTPKCRGQKYCTGLCYEMAMEAKGIEESQVRRVPKNPKAICPECGKEFERTYNAQRFCSAECRQKYSNKKSTLFHLNCAWCGKAFTYDRKKRYCSEECKLIANNKKKPIKRKAPSMTAGEIGAMARQEGLSYGQFVAKYGL